MTPTKWAILACLAYLAGSVNGLASLLAFHRGDTVSAASYLITASAFLFAGYCSRLRAGVR